MTAVFNKNAKQYSDEGRVTANEQDRCDRPVCACWAVAQPARCPGCRRPPLPAPLARTGFTESPCSLRPDIPALPLRTMAGYLRRHSVCQRAGGDLYMTSRREFDPNPNPKPNPNRNPNPRRAVFLQGDLEVAEPLPDVPVHLPQPQLLGPLRHLLHLVPARHLLLLPEPVPAQRAGEGFASVPTSLFASGTGLCSQSLPSAKTTYST